MPIRWHERVFVAGSTGSGKSEILNYLFSRVRCQKILLDTKGEFAIDGVPIARRADEIDWREPVIHFQDTDGDLDEYDRLAYDVLHRRNVVTCVHELADLCDDQPNRTPKWVKGLLRKGNIFGNGMLAGSQRPVGMPRQARSEAQHVIQMVPELDPADHPIVAKMMGLDEYVLRQHIGHAQQLSTTGEYSWVWFDQPARHVTVWPPLPDAQRGEIIVRRTANLRAEVERGTRENER